MFIFLIITACISAQAVKMNEEIQFEGDGTIFTETNGESVYDRVNGHGDDQQYSRELTTYGYGQARLTSSYMYKNINNKHQNDANYTGSYSAGLIMPDGVHHSLSIRSNRSINSTSIISYENGDIDSGSSYFDIESKLGNLSESVRDYSSSIPNVIASTTLAGNFSLLNELEETYIKRCTEGVLLKELNDVDMRGLNVPRTISTKGPQTIIIEGKEASPDVQANYMQRDAALEIENAINNQTNRKYEEARELYMSALGLSEKGLELDPNDPSGWINKANALSGLNNTKDAVSAYGEAIKLDPENVQAITGKALTLYKIKNYGLSLSYFSKSLEMDPTNDQNWYYYADALYKSSKYESALNTINKSLELRWDYRGLLLKALILHASGNWKEAVAQFDEGIQESPDEGTYLGIYYYYQGMAYYELSMWEKAIDSFNNAKELDASLAEDANREIALCEKHLNSSEDAGTQSSGSASLPAINASAISTPLNP
jgi:tetratricopeptide (TPR) repeat protein